jgi:hypothetical protein
MRIVGKREKRLAEAVAILVEEIHRSFPTASTRPIPSYEDEDFTLEIRIPSDLDRDRVMNICIRHAVEIEKTFGFTILIRVKRE